VADASFSRVRRNVEALRIALLSPVPRDLEGCFPALEEAVQGLSSLREEFSGGTAATPPLRLEIAALANDLWMVSRLIDNGAALNLGWAKLLGGMVAGYLPTGEPAPLTRLSPGAQSISFEG
jgi:hypothetical protein